MTPKVRKWHRKKYTELWNEVLLERSWLRLTSMARSQETRIKFSYLCASELDCWYDLHSFANRIWWWMSDLLNVKSSLPVVYGLQARERTGVCSDVRWLPSNNWNAATKSSCAWLLLASYKSRAWALKNIFCRLGLGITPTCMYHNSESATFFETFIGFSPIFFLVTSCQVTLISEKPDINRNGLFFITLYLTPLRI